MGFFLSGDWKLCGQAARREHVAVGEAQDFLLALIEEQPDRLRSSHQNFLNRVGDRSV